MAIKKLPKKGGEKMEKESMADPKEGYSESRYEGNGNMDYLKKVDGFCKADAKKLERNKYKYSRYD